ncbi:MAG: T9SS type A sorting domain-containing protein [Bacteroidota bacterium]
MLQRMFLLLCLLLPFGEAHAQVNYTANDTVPLYSDPFSYGANMGYYAPWRDEQLADIAAGNPALPIDGVGVTSLRPALFAHFLEQWGYDIRTDAFQHYEDIGIRNNVVFIGYPSPAQRDTTHFCSDHQSELFRNLYEPIWDNGENGTPVNDDNVYALYLYKMVKRYGPYVRIWEIWNEPDFDYSGNAWKTPDMEGNWWDNDPDPCGHALRAPIYHYIRLLRVSYEVIKSMEPEDYVATGGLGFPSYLDAILRNTDNPIDGSRTAEHPLGGGAYFDVLSFHSYPHIDGSLRSWNNDRQDFDYRRHSDAAADGVVAAKQAFEKVLHRYNYNGGIYPEKEFIITECNIPRKTFGNYIGSSEAQRNFLLKALVEVQKVGVHQFHIYQLGEISAFDEAKSEFHLMGLHQKLEGTAPYQQQPTEAGIAYRTISKLLYGRYYDEDKTREMNLPRGIGGAAFDHPTGETIYVLWAKTPNDRSELATASYRFPNLLQVEQLLVKEWDFSRSGDSLSIQGNQIQLSAAPVFVQVGGKFSSPSTASPARPARLQCHPSPFADSLNIVFRLQEERKVRLQLYDWKGRLLARYHNSERLSPGIYQHIFAEDVPAGIYFCKLEVDGELETRRVVKVQSRRD